MNPFLSHTLEQLQAAYESSFAAWRKTERHHQRLLQPMAEHWCQGIARHLEQITAALKRHFEYLELIAEAAANQQIRNKNEFVPLWTRSSRGDRSIEPWLRPPMLI